MVFVGMYALELIHSTIVDYMAYRHPQTKIVVVQKVVHQKDIIVKREVITKPDGTRIEKEETRDQSRSVNDVTEKEESKPMLSSQRIISNSVSLGYSPNSGDVEVGYSLRWKNVSVGVSSNVDEVAPKFIVGFSF